MMMMKMINTYPTIRFSNDTPSFANVSSLLRRLADRVSDPR